MDLEIFLMNFRRAIVPFASVTFARRQNNTLGRLMPEYAPPFSRLETRAYFLAEVVRSGIVVAALLGFADHYTVAITYSIIGTALSYLGIKAIENYYKLSSRS